MENPLVLIGSHPMKVAGAMPERARPAEMAGNRVLIVDDDMQLSAMLQEYLVPEGLLPDTVATGNQGLRQALRENYDLIVLDVMLPGLSGLELLRQLRDAGSKTPVLMLTARGEDEDRIAGLESGADDYLSKPFNPRELLARIRAILRRTTPRAHDDPVELEIGPLRANLRRREASIDGVSLKLTNAEFTLLATLMGASGEVVSRETLTRAALGRQLLPDDRSLDTHVSNLRRKLAGAACTIRSVRGNGYMLIPPEG